ncbi:hypothetical protein EJ110_NYTH08427 [Nymphaea thermarum]|nr:hypothetical protein EJ110_NYTH08427 [Nymphaea thermarum]
MQLTGRKFDDNWRDIKFLPDKLVNKDEKSYIQVKARDGEVKVFSPEEISAMVLTKNKETAEDLHSRPGIYLLLLTVVQWTIC